MSNDAATTTAIAAMVAGFGLRLIRGTCASA